MNGKKILKMTKIEEFDKFEKFDSYGLDEDDDPRAMNIYLEGQKTAEESLYLKDTELVYKAMGKAAFNAKRGYRNYID